MKRLLFFGLALISLSACQVNVVEPVYDNRDRVTGRYSMNEYSATYDDVTTYSIDVAKSSISSREILLYNFYALGEESIYANLDGDRISIPQQVVNGYRISGTGVFMGRYIDLDYTVIDLYQDAPRDFCESTATRY